MAIAYIAIPILSIGEAMSDPDLTTPGKRIRYARENAVGGWMSQGTLAEVCETDQSTISGWETDNVKEIMAIFYTAIARATGFPVGWLRAGGPTPSISPPETQSAEQPPLGPLPTGDEALAILELEMDLAVRKNRTVTRQEIREWLTLARAVRGPDGGGTTGQDTPARKRA